MAILTKGHYHCIECGTLFEAEIKDLRDQRCSVCGNPPTGKITAAAAHLVEPPAVVRSGDGIVASIPETHGVSQDAKNIYEATVNASAGNELGVVKRSKRKNKKVHKIWVMLGVWTVVMVLIVALVKYMNPEEPAATAEAKLEVERARIAAQAEAKKERMFVARSAPDCEKIMMAFLNARNAAAKAQYVYGGSSLSGVMNRYYQNNPSFSSTRSKVKIISAVLLDFPEKKSMGAICQNNQGEKFEAVFVFQDKEWKIDWKSFVRYDAESWSLFQAGDDGDEGEFRLYMRVRDADEDLERKEMSVVFYKPTIFSKHEFNGLASDSVRIAIDSPQGEKIQAMLKSEEELEKDRYGFPVGQLDPPSYHRVRVRLRLHKEEGEQTSMELIELLANHWYGQEILAATEPELE